MKLQRAGDLMTAIALLPEDHYVTFNKEPAEADEDDDEEESDRWLLTACVFQKAPRFGWSSRGAYFRHPPSSPSHKEPCPPQWEHDASVIFGVNAHPEEPEVLERLLINAIAARWGSKA